MQSARHLAAAAKGGGARLSEGNPYSNRGIGDVMNRRKWPIKLAAISGKLEMELAVIKPDEHHRAPAYEDCNRL